MTEVRIVVWNCAMALHAKWDRLVSLRPDIAIVPECACPEVLAKRSNGELPASSIWAGSNPNKGLGIFAFGDYTVARCSASSTPQPVFLPAKVRGPNSFNLLGCWAFNHRSRGDAVTAAGATRKALTDLGTFLAADDLVVAGDFNNSTVWDRPTAHNRFGAIAADLAALGLVSAYHAHRDQGFGAEREPTYYHCRGSRAYHIDYCFLPRGWSVSSVEVGKRAQWITASDHVPLTVTCLPPARSGRHHGLPR